MRVLLLTLHSAADGDSRITKPLRGNCYLYRDMLKFCTGKSKSENRKFSTGCRFGGSFNWNIRTIQFWLVNTSLKCVNVMFPTPIPWPFRRVQLSIHWNIWSFNQLSFSNFVNLKFEIFFLLFLYLTCWPCGVRHIKRYLECALIHTPTVYCFFSKRIRIVFINTPSKSRLSKNKTKKAKDINTLVASHY